MPNILQVATDCELFGADGITVHPRPDERHIKKADVFDLRPIIKTEFNIEGFPSEDFVKLVTIVKPSQVTLVPDAPDALTSSAGWDVPANIELLSDLVEIFHSAGVRTSIFVGTDIENIKAAARTGGRPHRAIYETIRRLV